MRLLHGRDTVTLFPLLPSVDSLGMPRHDYGQPIVIQCSPQWQTPTQNTALGLAPHTRIVVFARHWNGTPQCRLWWQGKTFEQIGEAKHLYGSARTDHYEIQANLIATSLRDPRTLSAEKEVT